MVSELLRVADASSAERGILLSVPYLTLLDFVSGAGRGHRPDAVQSQFLLAVSAGHDDTEEPTMIFLSERHPLLDDELRTEPVAC